MVEKKFKNFFNVSVILTEARAGDKLVFHFVAGEQQALTRYSEYFKYVLCNSHEETTVDEKICCGPEPVIFSPTSNMVHDVIRKFKNNRAPCDEYKR
jgi:hypothetical protein